MEQHILFLKFFVLGILLYLCYTVFSFIRLSFKNKTVVFIVDFISVLAIGLVLFLYFCAYSDGRIRLYMLLGAALGFIITKFTVGRLFLLFYDVIILQVIKKLKKFLIFNKKLLKSTYKMVYNIFNEKTGDVEDNAGSKKEKK